MGDVEKPVRVAAIDLGKVRVGIAVADELGMFAHPRPYLDGKNRNALLAALARLVKADGIGRLLVGLPLDMSGEEGPAARRARSFAQLVANATGVEVELVDERLTSRQASAQLRESGIGWREGKGLVDGVSAAVILQAWLDRQGGESS